MAYYKLRAAANCPPAQLSCSPQNLRARMCQQEENLETPHSGGGTGAWRHEVTDLLI